MRKFGRRPEVLFHCCVQKTASQWFASFFNEDLFVEKNGFTRKKINQDFLFVPPTEDFLQSGFESGQFITPLYITYDDFQRLRKPENFRAAWVCRDPRDIFTSQFFSITYSHKIINESHGRTREKLQGMPEAEALDFFFREVYPIGDAGHPYYTAMRSWLKCRDKRVLLLTYEEIFSEKQLEVARKLLRHYRLRFTNRELKELLEKHSFTNYQGREKKSGKEAHYRKGQSGDWRNYFTDEHKEMMKNAAGDVLKKLGYEKDDNW